MNNVNIFEVATRAKMRFPFRGNISVEDLWDLSVNDLDSIFKTLNARVKQTKEESLLSVKSAESAALDIQIAIVKHIVTVKLEEAEKRSADKARRAEKQKILEILNDKKDEALKNMSVEELQAKLAAMED